MRPSLELGAAAVAVIVERVGEGAADRPVAVDRVELETGAPHIARVRPQISDEGRREIRGLHQIMADELRQIGAAEGMNAVLPGAAGRLSSWGGPLDLRIHAPRQAAYERAQMLEIVLRRNRVQTMHPKALIWTRIS